MRWDLFCRVVDNLGDVGVCWRLASDLARRGDTVRLAIDDATALAWMAPQGCPGVEVCAFEAPAVLAAPPGDVVVEAFGCDPPPAFVHRMQAAARPPVWINLEYLSAEDWVERAHALPSPQPGGLVKWFFFPGFTPRTGGLLREPDLPGRRRAFDLAGRQAWLAQHGVSADPRALVVSLFCYEQRGVAALPGWLAEAPTLLLLTPGPAARQWQALGAAGQRAGLQAHALPWLPQTAFDELLWASDLAFVRGEDSLVRAVWSGVPFVWQAYPQHDGAHEPKVQALLQRMRLPDPAAALWRAWNGLEPLPARLPAFHAGSGWSAAALRWQAAQAQAPDLVRQLRGFARSRVAAQG